MSRPAMFLTVILPTLRGKAATEIRRALGDYWTLKLNKRPDLLGCAIRLLLAFPEFGTDWLARVSDISAQWQTLVTDILIE